MKLKLLIGFIVILLMLPLVSSFGPSTHFFLLSESLSRSDDTLIKQIIQENIGGCYAGLEYPDVGIFEYFTNFKDYKGLHSYSAVEEMLATATSNEQRAFAYCFKLHLAMDAISHNYWIPAEIKKTKLPNYIIHPIKELAIEGYHLDPLSNRLMEKHAEYDKWVAKAVGRDWSPEAERLNSILGGGEFYSSGYTPQTDSAMAKTQFYIYSFIRKFVSEESTLDFQELSILESVSVISGSTNKNLDPSGEKLLSQADASSQLTLYMIVIGIFLIIYYIAWRKRLI